jgi:hypothetical protein
MAVAIFVAKLFPKFSVFFNFFRINRLRWLSIAEIKPKNTSTTTLRDGTMYHSVHGFAQDGFEIE